MLLLSKFSLGPKLSAIYFCLILPSITFAEDRGDLHSAPNFHEHLEKLDSCISKGVDDGSQLIDCYRNITGICVRDVPVGEDISPCLFEETRFLSTQLREELIEKGFSNSQAEKVVSEITTHCDKLDDVVDHVCIQSALAAEFLALRLEFIPQE